MLVLFGSEVEGMGGGNFLFCESVRVVVGAALLNCVVWLLLWCRVCGKRPLATHFGKFWEFLGVEFGSF